MSDVQPSPLEPHVAAIVVNWNGWRHTEAALASLERSTYDRWSLIVVDNASSDDSVERLQGLSPRLRLVQSGTNLGFAGGCNLGVRAALEDDADAVFLLNSDATVRPETLGTLVDAHRETPDAVLGALVRFTDGGALQFFGSRRGPEVGGPIWFTEAADSAELSQPLIESDFIFGAALFAGAGLFERVGLFDERFFLTYEETDWCYRARAIGSRCLVVRDAVVDHVGSASLGSATSPLQAYFLQRNRLLFWEKHAGLHLWARGLRGDLRWFSRGFSQDLHSLARRRRLDATRRATFVAWRDYLFRRFGDSPASIRRLGRTNVD